MAKKIMVVDDSSAIRQTLMFSLKSQGYDVVEASDGVSALSLIRETAVGLLISDVNMPEMNGIELLKKIREDVVNRHTPVIMLTTESSMDLIEEAKKAGARAWIKKPFKFEQLIDTVKKLYVP